MTRIDETFTRLKKEQKTAFIGFLTAGDPNLKTSRDCLLEMVKNGCDIIEIGIPFSDPMAEGPVIQEASDRALQQGIKTDDIMRMVKQLRSQVQVPLVYLLYFNQIFTYGIERFMKASADAGIDAIIVPDLPYEHQQELQPTAQAHGITLISLITPASSKRKEMIAKQSRGFLYCVTSLGVTGERASFTTDLKAYMEELDAYTTTPKALGFGISNAEQIREFKQYADGVIVGSAIVRQIGRIAKKEIDMAEFGRFVASLANAAHSK